MKSLLTVGLTSLAALTITACGGESSGNLFDRDFSAKDGQAVAITTSDDNGYWETVEPYEIGAGLDALVRVKVENEKITLALKCRGLNNSSAVDQKEAKIEKTVRSGKKSAIVKESFRVVAKAESSSGSMDGCRLNAAEDALLYSLEDGILNAGGVDMKKLSDLEE